MSASNRLVLSLLALSVGGVPILARAEATASPAARSKAFNPDTSINFLGLYYRDQKGNGDRKGTNPRNGFSIQEAELQFAADVDVYFRANALFSISPTETGEYGIAPEEIYAESLSLPYVTLKAGKFKAAFGKHNQLHTHAYPFVNAPMINVDLLGVEGLNDSGLSASALLPTPWFSELTVQAMANSSGKLFQYTVDDAADPTGATKLYSTTNSREVVGIGSFRNLLDLSDSTTAELALYGLRGPNSFKEYTNAYGADLIFKWRPVEGGKYRSVTWWTQYIQGYVNGKADGTRAPDPTREFGGVASWVQYQFAERWWAQGRAELEGLSRVAGYPTKRRQSALVGFFPSEFSGVRLQYDHVNASDSKNDDHVIALQYNISIGAHPAHAY